MHVLLSTREVSERTGVPEATIRRWCAEGRIGTVNDRGEFVPLEKAENFGHSVWEIPEHLAETIASAMEHGVATLGNTDGGVFYRPSRTRPIGSRWCGYVGTEGRCRNVAIDGSGFCKDHTPTEEKETDT